MAQKISTFDDWTDYFSKWQNDNGFLSRSAPVKVYDRPFKPLPEEAASIRTLLGMLD